MSDNKTWVLPESLRSRLQRPLGKLYTDFLAAAAQIKKLNPVRVVTVGDMVTFEFLSAGLKPDIAVVDLVAMRSFTSTKIRRVIESYDVKEVRVKNPAAKITTALFKALESAKPPVKIIVDGEEDLAAIPAVLASPDGTVVVYGQPKEGLVLVEVNEKKKKEFRGILEKFEVED